jgi:hypothetical protein
MTYFPLFVWLYLLYVSLDIHIVTQNIHNVKNTLHFIGDKNQIAEFVNSAPPTCHCSDRQAWCVANNHRFQNKDVLVLSEWNSINLLAILLKKQLISAHFVSRNARRSGKLKYPQNGYKDSMLITFFVLGVK